MHAAAAAFGLRGRGFPCAASFVASGALLSVIGIAVIAVVVIASIVVIVTAASVARLGFVSIAVCLLTLRRALLEVRSAEAQIGPC